MPVDLIRAVIDAAKDDHPDAYKREEFDLHCALEEYLETFKDTAKLKDVDFYRLAAAIMDFVRGARVWKEAPPPVRPDRVYDAPPQEPLYGVDRSSAPSPLANLRMPVMQQIPHQYPRNAGESLATIRSTSEALSRLYSYRDAIDARLDRPITAVFDVD